MNQQTCNRAWLDAFLKNDLNQREEQAFTTHLDECSDCREELEGRAAEESVWREASNLLGGTIQLSAAAIGDNRSGTVHSPQIALVLQQLAPTDDPESLGRIGGYEVTGVVGAGGMGVVLKAHDRSLDRIVAIKVMSPHLASSGSARKRFAREAKAAAAVLHPNVIAIHSVASEDACPYLVMPYVRGASLQKRIDSQGPLPLKDTLRIGAQIAAGLAAAHEQGLVHRDIKPANILLEEGVERVTITDFGLARAVDDASMTCSGVIAGTPQYMSPEQARGEPIEARSDLFSLGGVLYAMCTGRSPFRAETTYGVLHRIANDKPTPACEVNSDVPAWLSHIIQRLMAKRPEDRFESAAQVAELLEGCLAHVQQPAVIPLPETVVALAPKIVRRPPFRKLIALAFGAFALVFAGVLIVIELDKGTITIESDIDNVPIRIMQGDEVVKSLSVSRDGKSTRVAAGNYTFEIESSFDTATIDKGVVKLSKGGNAIVRVTQTDKKTSTNVVYSVRTLIVNGSEKSVEEQLNSLIDLIHATIDPDSWKAEEVSVVPYPANFSLVVRQSEKNHEAISKLIEELTELKEAKVAITPPHHEERPSHGTPVADMDLGTSEVREVVLSMGTLQCMLDLDTGDTCPAPARRSDELEKFDIMPTQDQPYEEPRGLTVPHMGSSSLSFKGRSVDDELWNLPDTEILSKMSTVELLDLHKFPRFPQSRRNTVFFLTDQKTPGLWQLVGTERIKGAVNEPWGIRIRYKLFRSIDFERATKSVQRVFQYLAAVQENDREIIASIAKGRARNEQIEQNILRLIQESGTPKRYKNWFKKHSAVVALGPISSSNEDLNDRFLLFILNLVDERWSIVDIDLELEVGLLERFKGRSQPVDVTPERTSTTPQTNEPNTSSKSSPEFPPVKIVVHDEEGRPLEGVKISLRQLAKDPGGQVLEINETSNVSGMAVNRNLPYGHYELSATTADGWYLTGHGSRLNVEFEKGVDAILVAPTPGKTSKLVISSGITSSPDNISGLRFGGLTDGRWTEYAPEPEGSDSDKEKEFSSFPTITNGIEHVGAEIRLEIWRGISQPAPSMQQMNARWYWTRPPNSNVSIRYLIANGQARSFNQFDEEGYTPQNVSLKLPPVEGSELFKLPSPNYRVGAELLKLREPAQLPLELDIPAGDVRVTIGRFFGKPTASVMAALKWQPREQQPELWLQAYLAPDSAWVERLINIDWINSPFRSGGSVGFTALWRDQALQPGERLEIPLGMKQDQKISLKTKAAGEEAETNAAESSTTDATAKIIVDVYGGNRVLGQNNAKYVELVQALDAIDDVQVNFREAGPGSDIALAIVRDRTGLMNQEANSTGKPSARRDAITKALGQVPSVRWEEGALGGVSPVSAIAATDGTIDEAFGEQAETVNSEATADEAYQAMEKLLANPKMDWKSTESYIATAATRMTSNIEFAKHVLDHFKRACAGGESNYQARRNLLAVLTRAFQAWGQSRWSTDTASIQQHSKPSETRPQEIRDYELSALDAVVSYGHKATRSDIVDFVRAARALHHPDAKPFLQAVLLNPQTLNSSPYATPATVATPPKQSIWSDNLGGTWPDARFVAAVGLAELGDQTAIEWLLAKAKPNDFGLDESINLSHHERDLSGSLRESSRCALIDLFGQPKDSTVAQLSDWWTSNRSQVTPQVVRLKADVPMNTVTPEGLKTK